MSESIFSIRETWEEAVVSTEEGLSPLAVKLIHVPELPPIDAELALGDNHYPYTLICMTTVFTNEAMNGKLGWRPIDGETRQNISELLHDHELREEWIFLSQASA